MCVCVCVCVCLLHSFIIQFDPPSGLSALLTSWLSISCLISFTSTFMFSFNYSVAIILYKFTLSCKYSLKALVHHLSLLYCIFVHCLLLSAYLLPPCFSFFHWYIYRKVLVYKFFYYISLNRLSCGVIYTSDYKSAGPSSILDEGSWCTAHPSVHPSK